jgi:hypothetical protein
MEFMLAEQARTLWSGRRFSLAGQTAAFEQSVNLKTEAYGQKVLEEIRAPPPPPA